jgi:hypothetical protein
MRKTSAFVNIIASFTTNSDFFYLQVIDDTFKLKSENNAIKQNTTILKEATSMTEMVNY